MKTQINVKECGIPSGSVGLLFAKSKSILCVNSVMSGSRGGGGGQGVEPPGNSQKYSFLVILVWIPLKITKQPSQHSI